MAVQRASNLRIYIKRLAARLKLCPDTKQSRLWRLFFDRNSRIAPLSARRYAVSMQTELQNKWQQVLARDARQDGRFVFAVRTTGVFCRPSCPKPASAPRFGGILCRSAARPSAPAIARACAASQRKFPSRHSTVLRARQLLDNAEGVVTLAQLSKRVGRESVSLAAAV